MSAWWGWATWALGVAGLALQAAGVATDRWLTHTLAPDSGYLVLTVGLWSSSLANVQGDSSGSLHARFNTGESKLFLRWYDEGLFILLS